MLHPGVRTTKAARRLDHGPLITDAISSEESAIWQALNLAADMIAPPPKRNAAQWADSHRVLPEGSDTSGAWRTPAEWREIYAAAGLTEDWYKYRYVVLPCPSQSGKTEFLFNVIGHRLDDGPRYPVLYIGPTEDLTKDLVRDRVRKFVDSTPSLYDRMAKGQADAVLQKKINGIPWSFGWAGSAAQLASRPVGLVAIDELDRMPLDVGAEGSPFELADARTKRYQNAKVLVVSSPTIWGASPIWDRFELGTMHMWTWRCLSCGGPFVPEMKFLVWDDNSGPDDARASARLECPHCGHRHENHDKKALNQSGEYIRYRLLREAERVKYAVLDRYVIDEDPQDRLTASFWFSGLVPQWTAWGLLAYKLAAAKERADPNIIQSVVNTWFGEPFIERGEAPDLSEVLANVQDYQPRTIPAGVQVITCGVDVQKNGLYYLVRGWGYNEESWLLDYGYLAGETVFDSVWLRLADYMRSGIGTHKIHMTLIDSGYRPQFDDRPRPDHVVYSFCRRYDGGNCFPAKGRESMDVPVRPRLIDYSFGGVLVRGGVRLFLCDVSAIKRWLHSRLTWPADQPGRFNLHAKTEISYADQILSEEEIREPSGKLKWVRVNRENHYLDCEVYARAAAIYLRVGDLAEQPKHTESRPQGDKPQPPPKFQRRSLF